MTKKPHGNTLQMHLFFPNDAKKVFLRILTLDIFPIIQFLVDFSQAGRRIKSLRKSCTIGGGVVVRVGFSK